MPSITTRSGRTGRWTKMHPPIAPLSGSETLRHMLSWAACITIMYGFRFSVHTTDIGAGTWAVFYYELLAEPPREPRSDEPRENVRQSAGGRGDDDAHRPRRIALRPRDARDGRQRGGACCEMQQLPTGKFHG